MKPPSGPLAIHLGTNAGYCFDGRAAVWVLPKHSGSGYVGAALFDCLSDMIHAPSVVLVSAPLSAPGESEDAAMMIGLTMIIQTWGCFNSVPVELVHPNQVHTLILERGDLSDRQSKAAIAGFAKRRGITDPDAGAAMMLYEFGLKSKVQA